MKHTLVITSISAPNAVLKSFAEGCLSRGWDYIVIGDKASPSEFNLKGCDFYSLERQAGMPFKLAAIIPQKHYARKNLGYLQAIQNGTELIVESDDDNFPYPEFWNARTLQPKSVSIRDESWINLYRYYSSENIWPRGYPLEEFHKALPDLNAKIPVDVFSPVQQGLADDNPDVDAVYRLIGKLPVKFERNNKIFSLASGTWCPFNSQNTTWFKEAFPLLYLPSYCSFRMTDIWRSYVTIRICWQNGWDVLFHEPTVWQERNAHNLMKDFADEVVGYVNNKQLCEKLEKLELKGGSKNLLDDMISCYKVFTDMGVVDKKEFVLLDAWCEDMTKFSKG